MDCKVARIENKTYHGNFHGIPRGKNHLGDLSVDGRITLQCLKGVGIAQLW
jgi:hypothetical protein